MKEFEPVKFQFKSFEPKKFEFKHFGEDDENEKEKDEEAQTAPLFVRMKVSLYSRTTILKGGAYETYRS